MGILLLNSDHEISSTFQKNRSETVTLLIPEDTWLLFSEKDVRLLTKRIPTLLKVMRNIFLRRNVLVKKRTRNFVSTQSG
ncbi:hypothetical protein LEP1GSC158_3307 [Leptospira interrogans serovar Zanoni str. LT2156]|uniref:PF07600 domain protein n=1 Tax=Leptospira interrogans serovar Zanoni str. LT2156 TaxID=1001601 RepID=M6HJ87_LEPIR|nr:hypothetical protein LEP1GSC158_3307 [Leptospira interrogans serovar Zanoni str. LT2156]